MSPLEVQTQATSPTIISVESSLNDNQHYLKKNQNG